jgi:hypothetical protein
MDASGEPANPRLAKTRIMALPSIRTLLEPYRFTTLTRAKRRLPT